MSDTSRYTHEELSARLAEVERERDESAAMVGRLQNALRDAGECVEEWGGYASSYFQDKHDLAGDLACIKAALAETPPTALAEIRAEAVEAAINDDRRTVYTAEIAGVVSRVKQGMKSYAQQLRNGGEL